MLCTSLLAFNALLQQRFVSLPLFQCLNTASLSAMLGTPHSAVVAAGGFHGCPILPRAGLGTDAPPSA